MRVILNIVVQGPYYQSILRLKVVFSGINLRENLKTPLILRFFLPQFASVYFSIAKQPQYAVDCWIFS